jgi:hypothetical protein
MKHTLLTASRLPTAMSLKACCPACAAAAPYNHSLMSYTSKFNNAYASTFSCVRQTLVRCLTVTLTPLSRANSPSDGQTGSQEPCATLRPVVGHGTVCRSANLRGAWHVPGTYRVPAPGGTERQYWMQQHQPESKCNAEQKRSTGTRTTCWRVSVQGCFKLSTACKCSIEG